jgi:hypothetical protein
MSEEEKEHTEEPVEEEPAKNGHSLSASVKDTSENIRKIKAILDDDSEESKDSEESDT